MVVGQLVRVTLGAESATSREEHGGVLRAVRRMAFITAASAESGHWVVFEDEWPSLVRVADHALALERRLLDNRSLGWVGCVAVAADQFALRDGVVEVQSKFRDLSLVALSAESDLICLQEHLLLRLLGNADLRSRINRGTLLNSLSGKVKLGVWMKLVAGNAGQICLGVLRVLPVRVVHRLAVASQTSGRRILWTQLAKRNHFLVWVFAVGLSWTVTAFAAFLGQRKPWVRHKCEVRRLIECV